MGYERAARLNDPVGGAYASEGAIIGAGVGELLSFLITPPQWKAAGLLRKLLPIQKLWGKNPVWLLNKWRQNRDVGALLKYKAYQLNSKVTKAMREKVRTYPGNKAAAAATAAGSALGSKIVVVRGHIVEGSDNVFTNARPAARVDDEVDCHPDQAIETGCETVTINLRPAARVADETYCDDVIADGSDNVMMGGDSVKKTKTPENKLAKKLAKNAGHAAGVPTRDGRIKKPSTWLRWALRDFQKGATKTLKDELRDQLGKLGSPE